MRAVDATQPVVVAVVVAKAPVSGLAKTRLGREIGDDAAADLAAASLLDTLDAVEAWEPCDQRLLMLTGDLGSAARGIEILGRLINGWTVVEQVGDTFGERLVHAHRVAAEKFGDNILVVQIGMDTPSLTPEDLAGLAICVLGERAAGAALGPADDGGWWGIATRRAEYVEGLVDVAMSTDNTCALTAVALRDAGARVAIVNPLTDVDTLDDATKVAKEAPASRFATSFQYLLAVGA